MPTAQQALARTVETNAELLSRYLIDFDDQTHIAQAPGLPNHVIWTVGHCALTMHRAAELTPAAEHTRNVFAESFREDPAPPNNRIPMRFYTETVCFGSTPAIDPMIYPSIESGILIYERACRRLADAVRNSTDEDLDREHDWGAARVTFQELIGRIIFHNGMHTGQVANLRRALGMPSIFQSNNARHADQIEHHDEPDHHDFQQAAG